MDRTVLGEVAELNEPATPEEIEGVRELWGGGGAEYTQLLACSNGLFANDVLLLYGTGEIHERNATYDIAGYLPAWVMIGDDSGGYGVFLTASLPVFPVYLCDLGGLGPTQLIEQAPTLAEWAKSGFPLRY